MNEQRLRELLSEHPAPDEEGAMERGWRVARAGYGARPPAGARPRRWRLALALAGVCALGAGALTPPGAAVADWLRDAITPAAKPAAPPLRLPAPGRVLVETTAGPWIVEQDGSKRLLGTYAEATWSPSGLFVAATRARQLFAIEPGGRVRWSLDARRPVSRPRWSPSGYRIAYLSGPHPLPSPARPRPTPAPQALRVVAGDGTGDRLVAAAPVTATAPAWRPGLTHVLAYATTRGTVVVADVDSGRELWRATAPRLVRQLAWSPDGQRLLALGERDLRIFDARGQLLRALAIPGQAVRSPAADSRGVAFARQGHRFALIRASATRTGSEVVTLAAERRPGRPRPVFTAPGAVTEVEWSPDGTWLLVAWTGADQWVFVRAGRKREVRTVGGLAARFDPGSPAGPQMPAVAGWCCASSARR